MRTKPRGSASAGTERVYIGGAGRSSIIREQVSSSATAMWILFAVLCVAAAQGREVGSELFGEFKSIYTWPKLDHDIPNCSPLVVSEPDGETKSCTCERHPSQLSVVNVGIGSKKFTVLADQVSSLDELKKATVDKCTCPGAGLEHDIMMKIDNDYVLHHDTDRKRVYLLGKRVPTAEELAAVIELIGMKGKEGTLLCK